MEIGTISPDGLYQWDGEKWISVELTKLSDDGYWMWNGSQWIPNPNHQPAKETPIIQPQINHQIIFREEKKSKTGLGIAIFIVLPIAFVAITVVFAGFLYVFANDLSEDQDQTKLAGTWYNVGDTMTLYSNGTVVEASGTITHWSSQGYNFTTTFLIDEVEYDLIWKYEIKIDSDDERVLFMAYYDVVDGKHTNEIGEQSCVAYSDSVRGTEENYFENKRAFLPEWCEFAEV